MFAQELEEGRKQNGAWDHKPGKWVFRQEYFFGISSTRSLTLIKV